MNTQAKSEGLLPQLEATQCARPEGPCSVCCSLPAVRTISSEELLQGGREVFIVHRGQVYRLLHTRNDKLILQK